MSVKNPDVSLIKLENVKKKNFPCKYDYRIFIAEKAYKEIQEHATSNIKIEIGGVLLGNVFQDHSGNYLEITDIIKARKAENTEVNITFTHETWEDILNQKDSKYSNKLIVGWYHSHPDFDVFLSSQDMHIHNNFFNQPHQVAFVIDPVNNREGFFIWREGKARLIDEYWIGDSRKAAIEEKFERSSQEDANNDMQSEVDKNDTNKVQLIKSILKCLVVLIYIFALLFMLYTNFGLKYRLGMAEKKIEEYQMALSIIGSVYGNPNDQKVVVPKMNFKIN